MDQASVKACFERIHQKIQNEELTEWDKPFEGSGGLMDSLSHVEFVMDVERELNIDIPDSVIDECDTPNKLVDWVLANKALKTRSL